MASWGYGRETGPHKWAVEFPAAAGIRQSPIDIQISQAEYDSALADRPLVVRYLPHNSRTLSNSGRSFMVDTAAHKVDDSGFKPRPKPGVVANTLEGGPLANAYEMAQWHAHWGAQDGRGSEHTINGHPYAAEIHLVHWNSVKYKTFGTAAQQGDGLAVMSIFVKIGKENQHLKQITDSLNKVQHSGKNTQLSEGFDPAGLLPSNTSQYWTYEGSLTTPPCFESVIWIVFKEAIEISQQQIEVFRSLRSHAEDQPPATDEFNGKIIDNFRRPLPLGNRLLRASFR